MTLQEKVAEFKLIARENLRMTLISPRLSRITSLETELNTTTEGKERLEHTIAVIKYEMDNLDSNHPDYETFKKAKEETLNYHTEKLPQYDKETEEINKEITDQKEAIAKIESGETKVSLDALNELVDKMIRQDALNKVATVQ